MKKRLFFLCILGYLMPVLLVVMAKVSGCEMKYVLYLFVIGIYLLFLECLCLLVCIRRNKVRGSILRVLCYIGMLPFGLYFIMFVIAAVFL